MITSSPAVGMKPPGQGAFGVVELQFPLPAVVTVTAIDAEALAKTNSTVTSEYAASFPTRLVAEARLASAGGPSTR